MEQLIKRPISLLVIISLLLMLIFEGCKSYPSPTLSSTTGIAPSGSGEIETPLYSPGTVSPTDGLPINTPTPYLFGQITVTEVQNRCLNPQPLLNGAIMPDGVFFISEFKDNSDYFWDIEKRIITPFPFSQSGYRTWGARISPNRQWIAFEVDRVDKSNTVVEKSLRIFDAIGKEKSTIPWQEKWGVLREWLDNERLFIDGADNETSVVFIVNPFNNKTQKLLTRFTNIYPTTLPADWSISPNFDLTLALYLTGSSSTEGIGYTLWDTKLDKEIWHTDSRIAPTILPLWSSDFSRFAVVKEKSIVGSQADILVVNSSGKIIFQTDFTSKYSIVFVGNEMSWSPDGHYLAVWLSLGNDVNNPGYPSIVLFNLETGLATNLCITSFGSDGSDLIWSKDGRWLVTRSDSVKGNLLIDTLINKAFIVPLSIDGSIIGWLDKP